MINPIGSRSPLSIAEAAMAAQESFVNRPRPVPVAEAQSPWTPEDKGKVDAYIDDALGRHGGDVAAAFADIRDRRQQAQNYYDTNMAIAADHLRARLETQRSGPPVALQEVETYMALKRTVGVPQEGPGPVSPYSQLELDYMRSGVAVQQDQMSFLEKAWWYSPPGLEVGAAKAAWSMVRGEEH
jgi:hypothetical protein